MGHIFSQLTVIDIEKREGVFEWYEEEEKIEYNASLPIWYRSIRNKKLLELTIFDLGRVVRQEIFLEYTLYEVIESLMKDPFDGSQYSGELLAGLSRIDAEFWEHNESLRQEMVRLVDEIINRQFERLYEPEGEFDVLDQRRITHFLYILVDKLACLDRYQDSFADVKRELQALELLGKSLMQDVRDPVIRKLIEKLNRTDYVDEDERAKAKELLVGAVDSTLAELLLFLEEDVNVKLNVEVGLTNVTDVGSGLDLYSELYGSEGWIKKYSQITEHPEG